MIDFSKIKTIEELDNQTRRMQRRADIQRNRLEKHVDFVIGEYNHVIHTIDAMVAPVRAKFNEYRETAKVVSRIIRAVFGR